MTKALLKALVVCLLCIVQGAVAQQPESQSTVLMIDKAESGTKYSINGKLISRQDGLLLTLSRMRDQEADRDPELTVLANEKLRFGDVTEIMGIASKARYFRFRIFIFDTAKRVMYKLDYSKPVPFASSGID